MRSTTHLLVVGIAGVVLVGLCFQSDEVTKILPDAEKVKKSAKSLSKESIEKIEKALGGKLGTPPVVYEARAFVPVLSATEKYKVLVTVVEAKGPKGTVRLGVAAVPEERVLAKVGILKNGDDPVVESPRFLEQFEGYSWSDALWSAPEVLETARKKGAEEKDAEAREIALLLRLNEEMRKVDRLWAGALEKIDRKDKTAADDLGSLGKLTTEIAGFTKKIPFYKESQQLRYDEWMQEMGKGVRTVRSEVSSGKFDAARKELVEISSNSCSRCHASSQRAFRERRGKLGLGNGYFDPSLDVVNPDPAQDELVKAVLREIRRAALVIVETKP